MPNDLSGAFDDEKVPLAIAAARNFSAALRNDGHSFWAERIQNIAHTLEQGEVRDAVKMRERDSKRVGSGSLVDFIPFDDSALGMAYREYDRALENLRQKLKRTGKL